MLKVVGGSLLRVLAVSLRTHPAPSSLPLCFRAQSVFAANTRSFKSSAVVMARKKSEDPADEAFEKDDWPQDPVKASKRRPSVSKVLESLKLARLKSEEASAAAAAETPTRKKVRSTSTDRAATPSSASASASPRRASRSSSSSGGSSASSGNASHAAPPARPEDFMPSDSFIVTLQRRPLMPGTGVPMTLSDPSLIAAVAKMKAESDPRHKYVPPLLTLICCNNVSGT
jgi:hypothetical protein